MRGMKPLGDYLRLLPVLGLMLSGSFLSHGNYRVGGVLSVATFAGYVVLTVLSYLDYRRKRLKDEPHLPCERPGGLY
jgi:hypothetical protein